MLLVSGSDNANGGAGVNMLDLGSTTGSLILDFRAGALFGTIDFGQVVWRYTSITESRLDLGQSIRLLDVESSDPNKSTRLIETVVVLPPAGSDEAGDFPITTQAVQPLRAALFHNIEQVVGGWAEINIQPSGRIDRHDGTDSVRDIVDFQV